MQLIYILAESLGEYSKCIERFTDLLAEGERKDYSFYRVYTEEAVLELKRKGKVLVDGRETSQWIEDSNILIDVI